MNFQIIRTLAGRILCAEAFFMLPALCISLYCGERAAVLGFLVAIGITFLIGLPCALIRAGGTARAREGLATVGISWILVSLCGALPFFFSGAIPNFIDAFFESVSGFTTTGATVLTDIEFLPKGILYWRSFTHWLGGMGVLVFVLALGRTNKKRGAGDALYLMRAESPGPVVDKLVPKLQDSAKILYLIYITITALQVILLVLGKVPLFDSLNIAFSTMGTGGFSIKNDSLVSYSTYCQVIVTIFMILGSTNFNLFYLLLIRDYRRAAKNEELHFYVLLIFVVALIIATNIVSLMGNFGLSFHHALFQVVSIISTTGFVTVDYDLWPQFSRALIIFLMCIGAMAGSTGGGVKVSRVLIMLKAMRRDVFKALRPNETRLIHMDGEVVSDDTVSSVSHFIVIYFLLTILSALILSLGNYSLEANFTAALTCIGNVGPGLSEVGPMFTFAGYAPYAKVLLSFLMLIGRLELFPMMVLLVPSAWKK